MLVCNLMFAMLTYHVTFSVLWWVTVVDEPLTTELLVSSTETQQTCGYTPIIYKTNHGRSVISSTVFILMMCNDGKWEVCVPGQWKLAHMIFIEINLLAPPKQCSKRAARARAYSQSLPRGAHSYHEGQRGNVLSHRHLSVSTRVTRVAVVHVSVRECNYAVQRPERSPRVLLWYRRSNYWSTLW